MNNNKNSGRILIVDDTAANLKLLANILVEHNYIVHPASDGELALEFVRSIIPDLILLDIKMPGIDGYEVCRRLKENDKTDTIPIIFISMLEDQHDKVKAFQAGGVDYITKPFQPEEVLARVQTHLKLHEFTEHLEHLVQERTDELTRTNELLQQEIAIRIKTEEEINNLNLELEERVNERTEKLENVNKELEAFAYSVSHDLRAPLRHIDGYIELLEKEISETLNDKSRHYISLIMNSTKRMNNLIEDILSFSRMRRQEMSTEQIDFQYLIRDVISEFDNEVHDRQVEWHLGQLPFVIGDYSLIRIAMVNLVSNALKFTQGKEPAIIDINYKEAGNEYTFSINDNGVGFDSQYAGKLFGVFQRLHRIDEFEGTGIGLANVRRIIERHGGRTWAKGKLGEGATFYFSLPVRSL